MLALSPVCTRLLLAPKTPGVQIRKYHKVILNREREGGRAGGEKGGEREKEGRGELSRKGRKGVAGMGPGRAEKAGRSQGGPPHWSTAHRAPGNVAAQHGCISP